ncbi:NAD(P)-dependent oxidoreductase [Streptomyces sp. SPB074]|uniref:NAD(P)-dependent oxidoreductase n=1 Tax=Streptomyces sp. (strain SPB074) TaxID=465543 RepID=UPI0001D1DAA9|nr:NAD(P)-dependent oxidoreductase [Streptomyces sp. SPB074]EFG65683.1 3-hydroxyisobutyrate dehydrogenase [Streptomyces sp. SPB074]
MSDSPLVAVLGTGIMGAGMARSLLREGLSVRVWNRSADKARPLVADGAELAADPAAAVRDADVVLTVLNDGTAVASVMEQAAPGLRPGQPWLQASTVGLAATATLAGKAAEHGVVYLDSPVSGTKEPAEQGKLIVLVSGDEAARPTVTPVLDAIGQRTVWAGNEPGEATRLKLVVNAWLVNLVSSVAESLNVAEALDVDPRLFLDTVTGGALDSAYLQMKADALLRGALDPSFALSTALKDTRLILDATAGSGARLDLLHATAARFARARDAGHGGEDMIATYFAGRPGTDS